MYARNILIYVFICSNNVNFVKYMRFGARLGQLHLQLQLQLQPVFYANEMLKTCTLRHDGKKGKRLKFFGCKFLKKDSSANKEGPCPDRSTILVFSGGTE